MCSTLVTEAEQGAYNETKLASESCLMMVPVRPVTRLAASEKEGARHYPGANVLLLPGWFVLQM